MNVLYLFMSILQTTVYTPLAYLPQHSQLSLSVTQCQTPGHQLHLKKNHSTYVAIHPWICPDAVDNNLQNAQSTKHFAKMKMTSQSRYNTDAYFDRLWHLPVYRKPLFHETIHQNAIYRINYYKLGIQKHFYEKYDVGHE